VNEYQIGNRCSPLRGAFWSIIHDADLRDLCRGGETHADIVLKLAALSTTTSTLTGPPIPQACDF